MIIHRYTFASNSEFLRSLDERIKRGLIGRDDEDQETIINSHKDTGNWQRKWLRLL